MRAAKPADAAAVKAIVEAKRVEYDAIVSAAKLGGMGKLVSRSKGPVFEREQVSLSSPVRRPGTDRIAAEGWRGPP